MYPSRICAALLFLPLISSYAFVPTTTTTTTTSNGSRRLPLSMIPGGSTRFESQEGMNPLEVALLLPSSPENPMVQHSANEIVSKLSCQACATVCHSPEAESVCQTASVVVALGVESPMDVRFVATAFRRRRSSGKLKEGLCQFALGGKTFAPLVDAYDEANPTWQKELPWSAAARDRTLMLQMQDLFEKGGTEDYVEAITLYLDAKKGR
eukprot:scaffold326_cov165-Amphora_coffeaeformis.AAC.2